MNLVEILWGEQRLDEGLSNVLYHASSFPIEVVRSNKLEAGPLLGREYEVTKAEKLWFISTARSLASSYMPLRDFKLFRVIFELDGRKIQSVYTGKPTDFYSIVPREESTKVSSSFTGVEAEDRIVLDKPALYPLNRYLRRIIIAAPLTRDEKGRLIHSHSDDPALEIHAPYGLKGVEEIFAYGKKFNIPVDVLPFQGKHLHPKTNPIDHKEFFSFVKKLKIEKRKTEKNYFHIEKLAFWYENSDLELVNIFLHLHYLGWITEEMFLTLRPVKEWSEKTGEAEMTFDFSSFFIQIARHFPARVFLEHLFQIFKETGLKSPKKKDLDRWLRLRLEEESSILTNEKPDWNALEKSLPEEIQQKIERARKEMEKVVNN